MTHYFKIKIASIYTREYPLFLKWEVICLNKHRLTSQCGTEH